MALTSRNLRSNWCPEAGDQSAKSCSCGRPDLDVDPLSVIVPILPIYGQLSLRASCSAIRLSVGQMPDFWTDLFDFRDHRVVQKSAFAGWNKYTGTIQEMVKRGRLQRLQEMFTQLRRRSPAYTRRTRGAFQIMAKRVEQSKLLRQCLRTLRQNSSHDNSPNQNSDPSSSSDMSTRPLPLS